MVAVVTPFSADGSVDESALRDLVEWQIESGTDAIVATGTTGEGSTLSEGERIAVWVTVIDAVAGRVPVVCGSGTNDTRASVAATKRAKALGADGALVITPYYNKPSQAGLEAHFRAVASVGLPVVLYNVPGRTGVSLDLDTTLRLADVPEIVALKDATADIALALEAKARLGDRMLLLSGDDGSALPFWAAGGDGMISVTANVAPHICARSWDAFAAGDLAEARRLQERLMPLHRALFLESNPIPLKSALALMGRCRGDLRLPLVPAADATVERLRAVLTSLELV